jgi:hypothetical protein
MCAIIASTAGSRCVSRPCWRPWSWGVYVLRGFIASFLFLVLLENQNMVPHLVHVTIVGILSAQPLRYTLDATIAAGSTRVNLFYAIASAGVISVLASCILLWQVSVHWRSARRKKACLAVLLAASLATMILLTARIAVVEIPTISPVMAAYFRVPTPLQLSGAAILTLSLAAAVARRWSEPPSAVTAPGRLAWRRDEERYYHERLLVLLPLGGITFAECVVWVREAYVLCGQYYGRRDWSTVGVFLENSAACLSLVLTLRTAEIVFCRWSKRSVATTTCPPRVIPSLFVLIWLSLLAVIVCSAPILGSWHFARFLRSGYFPKQW